MCVVVLGSRLLFWHDKTATYLGDPRQIILIIANSTKKVGTQLDYNQIQ